LQKRNESLPGNVASEISRNVSQNFYFAFHEIFKLLSRNKIYEISRNFAKVTLQNCTETYLVYFLKLIYFRNLNFYSIFNYFVNKTCCEDIFLKDSPFKGTVSQDFLLWLFMKQFF
jgi:hypothetical protein